MLEEVLARRTGSPRTGTRCRSDVRDGAQDLEALGHDFGPDAVAGQANNVVGHRCFFGGGPERATGLVRAREDHSARRRLAGAGVAAAFAEIARGPPPSRSSPPAGMQRIVAFVSSLIRASVSGVPSQCIR